MPYLTVELAEETRPVLLIAGPESLLTTELIRHYDHNFRVIFLSSDAKESTIDNEKTTILAKSSFYFVDKLVEHVEYAIFVLDTNTRTLFIGVSHLLESDKARTLFLAQESDWKQLPSLLPHSLPHICDVIFVGHLLQFVQEPKHPVDRLMFSALVFSQIALPADERTPFHTIGISDALSGVDHALFGSHGKKQFTVLSYVEPSTFTAAAYILRKVEPELSIDLSAETETVTQENVLESLAPVIHTHYHASLSYVDQIKIGTFEESITALFEQNKSLAKERIFPEFEKKKKRKKISPSVPRYGMFGIKALLFGVVGFVVVELLMLGTAYFIGKAAITKAQSGNISQAVSELKTTQQLLSYTNPVLPLALPILSHISPMISAYLSLLPQGIETYTILQKIPVSSQGFHADLHTFSQGIAQIQAFLFLLEPQSSSSKLSSLIPNSAFSYASLLSIAPDLLGYKKDMTYLILFQNNAELRATGGFIGSVGKLTFHQGKMTEFTIQDVYDVDGQLKVHVEPNYIIRRYLEPHLYLRDSNFDPDFETSASQAAQLYYDSVHQQVDGVVGVDFDVLKEIMKAIGPIELDTYHTTITDSNILSFLESTIQDKFYPGSPEKKNVLNELKTQIQLKLDMHPELTSKIGAILPQLLMQKHILFAFPDASLQNLFTANNLSDDLKDLRSPLPNIPDMLAVNESNIGVNKVNVSVTRSVEYDVSVDQNKHLSSIVHEVLNNQSKTDDYRVYIRVLSPKGGTLQRITINGVEQHLIPAITEPRIYESKGFKSPVGLEVDQLDSTYHQIGFITTVPKQSKQEIIVQYSNGLVAPSDSVWDYSLFYVKQPGTETYPLVANVSYPSSFAPQNVQNGVFGENSLLFNRSVDSDQLVSVTLIQNSGN